MGLVDSISIVMAELVNDGLDAVMVALSKRVADQSLELEGTGFAFVVELVVQCLLNVGIHGEVLSY